MNAYEVLPFVKSIIEDHQLRFYSLVDLEPSTENLPPEYLKKDFENFEHWLDAGAHAGMHFMENNLEARKNARKILPDAKSALIFVIPYAHGKRVRGKSDQAKKDSQPQSLVARDLIARYARGKDYHKVIKSALEKIAHEISLQLPHEINTRAVVDSIPFLDRAHARMAGLGFVGKNTMLIRPGIGSFFFIATLLLSTEPTVIGRTTSHRNPIKNLDCGECQKCIDACPTNALSKPYFLDARLCLSYLTIEHRDLIPDEFIPHLKDTLYGCDICQTACPYNLVTLDLVELTKLKETHSYFNELTALDLALMNKKQYELWFGGTAATRAKYSGIVRNALYHLFTTDKESLKQALHSRKDDEEPLIKKTVDALIASI